MAARTPRMQQIEELLAEDPTDSFLRYGLAMEYRSAGDDATAAELLKKLLQDTPYVPAYLMVGQLLNELGKWEEAITLLKQGIQQAQNQGNDHAAGEMQGLLATIE
ncbi:MAG: tetratricopeptide repeat protein [Zavarzinella sp.]